MIGCCRVQTSIISIFFKNNATRPQAATQKSIGMPRFMQFMMQFTVRSSESQIGTLCLLCCKLPTSSITRVRLCLQNTIHDLIGFQKKKKKRKKATKKLSLSSLQVFYTRSNVKIQLILTVLAPEVLVLLTSFHHLKSFHHKLLVPIL